jgi:mono/diheme cytochrome c family protein
VWNVLIFADNFTITIPHQFNSAPQPNLLYLFETYIMKKYTLTILAAILLVASCSKKSVPTTSAKPTADGTAIFSTNCARCHGPQGIKDSRTPNLQTIALDKAGLVYSITNGKGHMPAFKDKLSTDEISAVADLILSWHSK